MEMEALRGSLDRHGNTPALLTQRGRPSQTLSFEISEDEVRSLRESAPSRDSPLGSGSAEKQTERRFLVTCVSGSQPFRRWSYYGGVLWCHPLRITDSDHRPARRTIDPFQRWWQSGPKYSELFSILAIFFLSAFFSIASYCKYISEITCHFYKILPKKTIYPNDFCWWMKDEQRVPSLSLHDRCRSITERYRAALLWACYTWSSSHTAWLSASSARAGASCPGLSLLFWFVYYVCLYFCFLSCLFIQFHPSLFLIVGSRWLQKRLMLVG